MKKNILMVLPLAATLVLPALAQLSPTDQQNAPTANQSSPSSPSIAQSATDQASSSPQMASGKEPLTYERHEGFWGKINPFARKKYVQRQMQPIREQAGTFADSIKLWS